MYDITKLKELASMFNVEVDLWGTEQDRLTMSGKTSDINKFWEAAERQGLLDKDPFDESYDPEETSWMDALIDTLRTYPSNDEIENDAFLKELRELYYKHYPDSDKVLGEERLMERMDFDTLYKKVKEQDRPIQEGLFGTLLFNTSFANELYDEFYRPLTDLIKKGDKEGAMKEWEDLKRDFEEGGLEKKKWARTFVEVQKARMEKYKAQIDAMEDAKVEEPAMVEALTESKEITFSTCDELAKEECPYLIGGGDNKLSGYGNRYELTDEELWDTGWIGAVQNLEAGPFESFDQLDIYCYDREKGVEYDLPEIPEDIKTKFLTEVNKYITEVGTMEEGYKPHTKRLLKLIGSDKLEESNTFNASANEYELVYYNNTAGRDRRAETFEDVENDWKVQIFRADSDLDAWKETFERVTGYSYDDWLNQDADETEFVQYFNDRDWSDGSPILISLKSSEETLYDNGYTKESWMDKFISDEYDDYEESYTPVSEELDDNPQTDTFGKAENVEFVMTCYIPECPGIESVKKVNATTYQVLYNGTEVEIVFDFSWNEWVYTINGKGPFSHSSYEWLISDIRSITDQESIDESFNDFGDLTDKEAANELGGEMIYCDTCGTKLAFDEYGSYCPKCSQEDPLDDTIEELHESGFDTHSDIDLDMVGTRIANLLDEDNLGDDWIEFDCKDSRGLIGTPDLHMSFEATGSDKVLRGYMRAHIDDTIDVYITNGSEGKFRTPREIARFIASEFGLFNHNI